MCFELAVKALDERPIASLDQLIAVIPQLIEKIFYY